VLFWFGHVERLEDVKRGVHDIDALGEDVTEVAQAKHRAVERFFERQVLAACSERCCMQ
jgi:hypothetical protein